MQSIRDHLDANESNEWCDIYCYDYRRRLVGLGTDLLYLQLFSCPRRVVPRESCIELPLVSEYRIVMNFQSHFNKIPDSMP